MPVSRRDFIKYISFAPLFTTVGYKMNLSFNKFNPLYNLSGEWTDPPREFSQAPFWFWNDDLSEKEIARQIEDFSDHGIYGFIIHPRVGLPKSIGFLSERMIYFMRFAINEAKKKNMWCMLYDEGMYPSGSASGLVVKENPLYRPHGLFAIDLDEVKPKDEKFGFVIGQKGEPEIKENQKLIAIVKRKMNGHRIAILDRFISPGFSLIRGLHFLEKNPKRRKDHKEVAEEMPPLADILNPESVKCFIKLVYQRYYDEFKDHFGTTIKAIFTDEPSFFGKKPEKGAVPGNKETITFVNQWLKKDITRNLPALWFKDEPGSEQIRKDYYRALNARLDETYYKQLFDWCEDHNTSLTGHPAHPDDIGHLRFFQIPGQDNVWRNVDMDKPNAIEGPESTNAKCASSAMIHLKRSRNSNEYCGAYGHNLSFEEMQWFAHWLIIRGCNLLYPHAFFYSIRGPRIDERPPDVGPNSKWWNDFKPFSDNVSRLCWLNTDSRHICTTAILGLNDYLPWKSAKVCFQNQYDFNYLDAVHLKNDAVIDDGGIHIAGMNYKTLIVEFDPPQEFAETIMSLDKRGRTIRWNINKNEDDLSLLKQLGQKTRKDVFFSPGNNDIRVRHVVKHGIHFFMLFNEGKEKINTKIVLGVRGKCFLLDKNSKKEINIKNTFQFQPHKMYVFAVEE